MKLVHMKDAWVRFVNNMNTKGIPIPLVRDPKTGRGDVALTLVFISSIWFQIGLIGKWSGALGGINMSEAFEFFVSACSLYWARKLSTDGRSASFGADVDPADEDQKQ